MLRVGPIVISFFLLFFYVQADIIEIKNGRVRKARFSVQQGPLLEEAKKSGRYVFLTGDFDGNLRDTQGVVAGFQREGFQNITYIQVP